MAKKRSRVPGTHALSAEQIQLERALVAKWHERGLAPDAVAPEVIDEVVNELYGGWTPRARVLVEIVGQKLSRLVAEASKQEP